MCALSVDERHVDGAKKRPAGHRRSRVSRQGNSHWQSIHDSWVPCAAIISFLVLVIGWSFWPIMTALFHAWQADDDYSSGQLIPLVVVFLIWRDRRSLRQCTWVPCWWGIGLVLLSLGVRTYGMLFMSVSLPKYSLMLCISGVVLTVAGWRVFCRVFWGLAFLFLAVPLPRPIHNAIAGPLQGLATSGAVFFLEAFSIPVNQQGNVVMLGNEIPMAVAEACSGLRMLTAFVVVSAFVAQMVRRPRWQKATLVVSSIPIAVVANIIRIFLTAIVMIHISVDVGEKFFHDFAGFVMMPAAVVLIFGVIWLMDRLVLEEKDAGEKHVVDRARSVISEPPKTTRRSRGSGAG